MRRRRRANRERSITLVPGGRAILAALAVLTAATIAPAEDLAARLQHALAHPGLRGATVGALVVRADDGAVLFEHNAGQPLAPASNLKILTALAALQAFGPAHRFTTRILADAPPDAAGAVGTLALQAGGDPALTSEEWWRLSADLRRLGIRSVRDGLLIDDGYFDQQRWNPAWQGVSARAFHAGVAALTANYGTFTVWAMPNGAVAVDPPVAYLKLVDGVHRGGRGALEVERREAGERDEVLVSGAPPREPAAVFRSVSDPVRYAASVWRMQLAANGISAAEPTRYAPLPPGAVELLAFEGKPLADVLRLLMKYSNNNIAEMLVKDLGAQQSGPPGSWTSGVAAVRQQLAALGVDTTGLVMVDGSGLSAVNRVSARTLVSALRAARNSFGAAPEFLSALPIAGRDGTLKKRAADARDRVRAKTGLINGVASLSGFARLADGHDAVFSILVNGADHGDAEAMAANDAFIEALVR